MVNVQLQNIFKPSNYNNYMLVSDKNVQMEFDLPNFNKNEIKVKLNKNSAQINGEKKHKMKTQRKDFLHEEVHHHTFHYETTLPDIDPKKATTKFSKGKLKIKAPRV